MVGHSLGGAVGLVLAARGVVDPKGLLLLAPVGIGDELDNAFIDQLPELVDGEAAFALLQ